ncbi:flavin monoamine oxidase family protein [Turneriella parva]|uniref:Amine oxidase n=1 Tax=Turneriella parva (strain ATCC BAA-1111 / DSM 21527 / NCTC 11395 / H) TaxID=869212 RepID=I4B2K2_TURPD|nr:FAD-dependent oxidoreductase [Turneriella parva]AFM11509.1 amine oxidase [Turneriella parva DSM 21527]
MKGNKLSRRSGARSVDVVVIGAGFAGLTAARALEAQGLKVQVIEARDRVGGRSRPGKLFGRTIDTGGQWVGVGHERLTRLVHEAGAELVPQYSVGKKLVQINNKTRYYSGLIPPVSVRALIEMQFALWRLTALQRKIDPKVPWQSTLANLDTQTVADWQRRWLRSDGAQALFDIGVRAIFCAKPGQLSMLHFLTYLRANGSFNYLASAEGGAQAATVKGGMHQLSVHLAKKLQQKILFGAPVQKITQSSKGVVVTHSRGNIQAKRVVLAVAPALARKIEGDAMTTARRRLGERMPMGSVIKCLIAYKRPFWREQGFTGEFVSNTAGFSPMFDASPADGSCGILVGFFDGPTAVRWSSDADGRRREVIRSVVAAFGAEGENPVDYVDHDWITDPFSEGCYVGLPAPGALTELGASLRAPHGRVHYAGTETASEWIGYIEGAIESGERAAIEVCAAL